MVRSKLTLLLNESVLFRTSMRNLSRKRFGELMKRFPSRKRVRVLDIEGKSHDALDFGDLEHHVWGDADGLWGHVQKGQEEWFRRRGLGVKSVDEKESVLAGSDSGVLLEQVVTTDGSVHAVKHVGVEHVPRSERMRRRRRNECEECAREGKRSKLKSEGKSMGEAEAFSSPVVREMVRAENERVRKVLNDVEVADESERMGRYSEIVEGMKWWSREFCLHFVFLVSEGVKKKWVAETLDEAWRPFGLLRSEEICGLALSEIVDLR